MTQFGQPASNTSKGCGAIMRIAPVGLHMRHDERSGATQATFDLAVEIAALTHGHPTGHLAAGAFAVLVRELVAGVRLEDAIVVAKDCLRRRPHHEETLAAIDAAERAASEETGPREALARLGEGWTAEEALAIAVYCCLCRLSQQSSSEDAFVERLVLAVNHGGDSDSTGSLTGQLLGAAEGLRVVPQRWLSQLELGAVIATVAEDLYCCREWTTSELEGNVSVKYPGF
jgi:ADP-ribosyl-[dinitrogen reductase] hydrolase